MNSRTENRQTGSGFTGYIPKSILFQAEPSLLSYEKSRDNIYCWMIRTEQNEEMLKRVPHEPWMDLAVSCYVQLEQDEYSGGVQITNELLKMWDADPEEVMQNAWKNTIERKEPVFMRLGDAIRELCQNACCGESPDCADTLLYVLSNREKWYGAVCIAYPMIPLFIEKTLQVSSFYIFPSSVHECLILPDLGCFDKEDLNDLLQTVNETEVADCDILGSHVYYYANGHIQPV